MESVAKANRVETALKGGMTPPLNTASITSNALRRTCKSQTVNASAAKDLLTRMKVKVMAR